MLCFVIRQQQSASLYPTYATPTLPYSTPTQSYSTPTQSYSTPTQQYSTPTPSYPTSVPTKRTIDSIAYDTQTSSAMTHYGDPHQTPGSDGSKRQRMSVQASTTAPVQYPHTNVMPRPAEGASMTAPPPPRVPSSSGIQAQPVHNPTPAQYNPAPMGNYTYETWMNATSHTPQGAMAPGYYAPPGSGNPNIYLGGGGSMS